MDTIVIDRKGARIDAEAGRFIVHLPESERPLTVPATLVRSLVISASTSLNSTVILLLQKMGASLVVLNPKDCQNAVTLYGSAHGNHSRRIKQFRVINNLEHRLYFAKQVVAARLRTQYRLLCRSIHKHQGTRRDLFKAKALIKARYASIQTSQSLDNLRGIEGSCAAAYFQALAGLLPTYAGFTRRQRRPPKDPANALLSLTYTLVHSQAVVALREVGLEPAMGALHDIAYARDSLACDLTELLRSTADAWVIQLLTNKSLTPQHFANTGSGCFLNKEGRGIYYQAYYQQRRQWQERLRTLAQQWAALVDNSNA